MLGQNEKQKDSFY